MEDNQARLARQQLDEKISRELMAGMQNDLSNVSAEAEDVLASLGGDLFSDDSASILTSIGKPRASRVSQQERAELLEEAEVLFPQAPVQQEIPVPQPELQNAEPELPDLSPIDLEEEDEEGQLLAQAVQELMAEAPVQEEVFFDTAEEAEEQAEAVAEPAEPILAQITSTTRLQRIFLSALACVMAVSCISIAARFIKESRLLGKDEIFGVTMEGVSLEGMGFEEAAAEIETIRGQKNTSRTITLKAGAEQYTTTLEAFSPDYDVDGAFDLAYGVGRTGGRKARLRDLYTSRAVSRLLYIPCSFDETAVTAYVADLADRIDQPVQDASIEFDPQMTDPAYPFITVEEQEGRTLDQNAAIASIRECAVTGDTVIDLSVATTKPTVFLADLKENVQPMRTFTTEYARIANRTFNIHRATDTINGTVIQPGEEFSFNRIVGNTSLAENGYREAGVIVGGRSSTDRGGGVCQAATTIYNVAVRCDMEITARDPHAIASSYVPRGQDATIAYGHCDLAFINTSDHPIYIVGTYTDTSVTFTFFGRPLEDGVTIEMESEHLGTRSPGAPKITIDPTKPTTYEETVVSALNGYDIRVYKVWFDKDGNEIRRVVDHTDAYPTRRAEIIRGGMEVAAPDPTPDPGEGGGSTPPPDPGEGA